VALIADLIETFLLPADLFDRLKARAVTAHQLTDIQGADQLLAMPPMGQQKRSELLAEMLWICPREKENSVHFNCLPVEAAGMGGGGLRVLLSGADKADSAP
jgi:hypothetical protein